MKASEARIGNIVHANTAQGGWWVEHIVNANDFRITAAGTLLIEAYEGIPITKKLLTKLGFEELNNSAIRTGFKIRVGTSDLYLEVSWHNSEPENKVLGFMKYNDDDFNSPIWHTVEFIHQIQNICFYLMNSELTITNHA